MGAFIRSALLLVIVGAWGLHGVPAAAQDYAFPDDVLPPQVDDFPQRPRMLIEWGDKFYDVGELPYGVSPWRGTYWQPALWVFGDYRTFAQVQGVQGGGAVQSAQWRNRLDLLANLRLSGTERIFVGFRPLDRGGMTGVDFVQDGRIDLDAATFQDTGLSTASLRPVVYFIEGDLAELFQFLDYEDRRPRDIGFTFGRQNVFFQEGLLVNDIMDVVALTFNGLYLPGLSNLRISALWAFGEVNAGPSGGADLYGLFTEADYYGGMVNLDLAYVDGDLRYGDGLVVGTSRVRQRGFLNTSFRVAASLQVKEGTEGGMGEGVILFHELSRKHYPAGHLVYFNHFIAYKAFTPASTQPPGPLGRIGLLFGGSPLGGYVPALGPPVPRDEVGASLGYQWMLRPLRRQVIAEVGGRRGMFNGNTHQYLGAAVRVQQAFGNRYIFEVTGFLSHQRGQGARLGSRFGFLVKM